MRKLIRRGYRFLLVLALAVISGFMGFSQPPRLHVISLKNPRQLRTFLRYGPDRSRPDRIPFVSAHRGGPRPGYPENCLATFENTLRSTWAMLEIDPRYSKDSAIVLMHDPTLDRTTTGHGKVSGFTLEELRKLRLKDPDGRVTDYPIPTLGEALEWAKGKTVLIVDQKDVPMPARVQEITKHRAEANALVMAYTFEDAQLAYALNPEVAMEVFIPDREAADRFEQMGVSWQNVVAFVTHTQPKDATIFQHLHKKGTLAIVGSSRTIDKAYAEKGIAKNELDKGYLAIIASGADIIEADLAIEAGEALRTIPKKKSSKDQFFKIRP
ncbi:glycerophosphodiester phosphodiesterase family protein [Salmonirosea aquatica]|uniref:Glycerophosphodiester phosphodiesterase n=1 Tax=Salmonirosea aquatica TaxID=2654236 RepID=A0A7C9BFL5_9BACT|nr:glycerophosphodiester phosphodiesterase [Cytophagaceae bacterium SJW1-29]